MACKRCMKKHLLQAIYEGVVFSHMTHLNFLKKRFPYAKTLRLTGGPGTFQHLDADVCRCQWLGH